MNKMLIDIAPISENRINICFKAVTHGTEAETKQSVVKPSLFPQESFSNPNFVNVDTCSTSKRNCDELV